MGQGQCEQCHNNYKYSFDIIINGFKHTFDCFECAINKLAPICNHCQCKIIGHGVEGESEDQFFCCDHCFRAFSKDKTSSGKEAGL